MQRNNSLCDDTIAGHRHVGTTPTSLHSFGSKVGGRKSASTPFVQVEEMCHVTQNLPRLWNLHFFQVVKGIPNIEALTRFLPLGIGDFWLNLGLRLNTRREGRGRIGQHVGWNFGCMAILCHGQANDGRYLQKKEQALDR